ncbi:class I SAM-dependent methyltransferase [Candidatus Magnetaquiglobus chichijimensis]|uniref:class I SAM-dependent methyltransferase n=1 Tax=Candidatus Magnetaquiglobus chichijimensis TaxID=3141448 RepID=UPI003B972F15
MGRRFFSCTTPNERARIRVLEIGCGSCSNLWMVAREGFEAHGIDLSSEAIELGHRMMAHWGVSGELKVGSMTELPYPDESMDVVLDVFSSYCLPETDFRQCLAEVVRVLKPGGLFFSYSPSMASDAFRNHAPARKIDEYTLGGILRTTSPYFGNDHPFRFISPDHYQEVLTACGLVMTDCERVGRSYRQMQEYFEFVVITASRGSN